MERLALHIESLIFSSEHTINLAQIKTCVEETLDQTYKNVEIKKALDVLIEKYNSEEFSFEIVEIASGFKFLTKGSYHNTVSTLIKKNNQKRLSKAALETLAIIAYKQPVTKSDVEGIRGVNADYTIQKLLEKELVAISGRGDGPGRPLLYTTSEKFMDYFGIKDVGSLPKLKDLKVPEIQIGEPAPIEEDYVESVEDTDDQEAAKLTEEALAEVVIDEADNQEDTKPSEEAIAEVAIDDADDQEDQEDQEDTKPTEEAIAEVAIDDTDDQEDTKPTEEAIAEVVIDDADDQEDTKPTEEAIAEVAIDDADDQEDTKPTEEAIAEVAIDDADNQEDTNPTEEAIAEVAIDDTDNQEANNPSKEAIAEASIDDTDNQEANNPSEEVLAEVSEDVNESPETTDAALETVTDSELEAEEVVGQSADQSENGIVITEADPEPIDRVLVKEEDHLTNTNISNEEE